MPATQHDAVLWLSGGAYDVIFDTARAAIAALGRARHGRGGDLELAVPARPRPDRLHRRHREPDAGRGAGLRARPRGQPGRGRHRPAAAEVGARRRRLGGAARRRSKSSPWAGRSSTASSSTTSRPTRTSPSTDQDRFGHIFRRNMAVRHGHRPRDDVRRLRRRAAPARGDAEEHGRRAPDALTRYTHPLTRRLLLRPLDRVAARGIRVGLRVFRSTSRG